MNSISITENVTIHSARHIFATVITFSNGVFIETISKLLKHTKISTTQIYAKVLENKLSSDISKLDQKIGEKRRVNSW